MMRYFMSLLLAVVMSACATSTTSPDDTASADDPRVALAKFVRADVVRARDIAAKNGDIAGVACSGAILTHIPEGGTMADMLTPVGVFSTYMFGRELHRSFRGVGVPEDVHIACAPLVVDANIVAIRLGLIAGSGGTAVPVLRGFGR